MDKELKDNYIQFLYDRNHSVMLTLKFDFDSLSDLTMTRMRNTLRAFDSRLNRKLLGPNWTKKVDQHIQWDAFAEKIATHGHWHLLAKVDAKDISQFVIRAERAWQELKGTDKSTEGVHATIIYDNFDLAKYVTKELKDSHINSLEFKTSK